MTKREAHIYALRLAADMIRADELHLGNGVLDELPLDDWPKVKRAYQAVEEGLRRHAERLEARGADRRSRGETR